MAELPLTGADLADEHVGLHLAHTSLPGFARIDGVVAEIERHPDGGAWVKTRVRPYGYKIKVATFFQNDRPLTLHTEPIEEVRVGAQPAEPARGA